jgi:hypothetical protein
VARGRDDPAERLVRDRAEVAHREAMPRLEERATSGEWNGYVLV